MPFSRIAREWTHLKMLKRGGYGGETDLSTIGDGDLALLCPACPQPNWNLPENWNILPTAKQ